jgi:hypothetical protein
MASALWPLLPGCESSPCKVCNTSSPWFDCCDVNKGGPPDALARPSLGQSLNYHRCPQCGLIFSPQLDTWQPAQYKELIYNSSYIEVDPDYTSTRPLAQAEMLSGMLQNLPSDFSLLDYGAGSGILAQQLNKLGIAATSEDPFSIQNMQNVSQLPTLFHVVCAFEVLEHSAYPLDTLARMRERLLPNGLMIVSTLLQPDDITEQRCNWWYCAPRNGHISLFSSTSLGFAFRHCGAKKWHSLTAGLHVAYF